MNKIFEILIISLVTAVTLIAIQQASAIYEDQLIVCNFEDVCTIINTDDYMSEESSNRLWNMYNIDLDTFDMSEGFKSAVNLSENSLRESLLNHSNS